jgi:hypothetical protein
MVKEKPREYSPVLGEASTSHDRPDCPPLWWGKSLGWSKSRWRENPGFSQKLFEKLTQSRRDAKKGGNPSVLDPDSALSAPLRELNATLSNRFSEIGVLGVSSIYVSPVGVA